MDAKVTLVIGGSLSGIQSALKQAEEGNKVYLLESAPGLNGEGITSGNAFDPEQPFTRVDCTKLTEHPNIEVITNRIDCLLKGDFVMCPTMKQRLRLSSLWLAGKPWIQSSPIFC